VPFPFLEPAQLVVQTFMVFISDSASVLVLKTLPSPTTTVVVAVGFWSTMVHFFVDESKIPWSAQTQRWSVSFKRQPKEAAFPWCFFQFGNFSPA
jgi:hypothetical protein